MSATEGDVSLIRDEDVLRRMWQQTEDFSRKKEIRAHMYRLREERLRTLYAPPSAPSHRTDAKGCEFTAGQAHAQRFADQSFQSIKSKEVRDAGSPPRDYTSQELKEGSGASWSVQAESAVRDGGRTHVKSTQAHVAGQYDVLGGEGRFHATDLTSHASTRHRDEHTSVDAQESRAATAAHDHVVQRGPDGTTLTSQTSSSCVSQRQEQSSTTRYTPEDQPDHSSALARDVSQHHDATSHLKTSTTERYQSSKQDDMKKQGELTSRKVEYPDENTKVIVETRTLPDGTRVTSTRREMRGARESNKIHSEQLSHNQTTQSSSETRRQDVHHTSDDTTHTRDKHINKSENDVKYSNKSVQKQDTSEFIEILSDSPNLQKQIKDVTDLPKAVIEEHSTLKKDKEETGDVFESKVSEDHYQTTYTSDFTAKKISSELSPTHQAWASTLRGDSPNTPRSSTRGSSPSNYRSSTSSPRSSVSPDKTYRKPSSRGTSPTKYDRPSASHRPSSEQDLVRHTSPERKTHYPQSPSPRKLSPTKETYRFVDSETKTMNTQYSDGYTRENIRTPPGDYMSPDKRTRKSPTRPHTTPSPTNDNKYLRPSQSPERYSSHPEKSQSPIRNMPVNLYTEEYSVQIPKDKTTTINTSDTIVHHSSLKKSRSPSPPKGPVTFDTVRDQDQNSPTPSSHRQRSPVKSSLHSPTRSPVKERSSPSASKDIYETYDRKNRISKDSSETRITRDEKTNDYFSTQRHSPSPKQQENVHSSLSKPTNFNSDFLSTERKSEQINRVSSDKQRHLVTPSTSPTRKPKVPETELSTGQSSPTTSVSEILYFSSPNEKKEMVTDIDEVVHTEYSNHKIQEDRPQTLDFRRSPSPAKQPCKSPRTSPDKQFTPSTAVPRKSSLKKPSSDQKIVSPIELPPTTFQIPSDYEPIHPHKIVKKDRPDHPVDPVSNIKDKPPFKRSETYEERCRKILGMTEKDSLIIEAEKTVKKIISNLPVDLNEPSSKKTSASVSPCPSPIRGDSPLREYSVVKNTIQNKSSQDDFLLKEKSETIKEYTKAYENVTTRKSPSRETSPAKLLDITNIDSATPKDTSNKHVSAVTTLRNSVSPERKLSGKSPLPNKMPERSFNSRTPSPLKKNTDILVKTTDFSSSEREQQIIDRVNQTLRNISPTRDQTSQPSSKREPSPKKMGTSLKDIIDTEITTKIESDIKTEDVKIIQHRQQTKVENTNKSTTKTVNKTTKFDSKPGRTASPGKRPATAPVAPVSVVTNKHSPAKSRSESPRKAATSPITDKRPQSPQVDKLVNIKNKVNDAKTIPKGTLKKLTMSDSPPKQWTERVAADARKDTKIVKQNSFTKTTTLNKNQNNVTSQKTKISSVSHAEIQNTSPEMYLKKNGLPKPIVDLKITRTISDTSIKGRAVTPTAKTKSKQEINLSNVTKSKITKETINYRSDTAKQTSRNNLNHSNLTNKPKSATTLNNRSQEDDIIVDIQQAKSSRGNSPDHICPTPISSAEETGKPRLPDEVSEPDDIELNNKRNNHTIHEHESLSEDIVEICDSEDTATKLKTTISEVDRVTGSDECLLSVTDKVHKFLKETDASAKAKTSTFKTTERLLHSDFLDESLRSDECLLSVSEKVNKFVNAAEESKSTRKSCNMYQLDDTDESLEYQDNYTKLSVNDKATLFIKTAEQVVAPVKLEPSVPLESSHPPQVKKPLVRDIDDLDRVEKTMKNIKDISRHEEIRAEPEERENREQYTQMESSYARETVSSHAKVRDSISPHPKPSEKTPISKTTALRSSETVKKAKAMFENIASQQVKETQHNKTTKLTDIGVFHKSAPTDSTIALHSDNSPTPSDIESEVDIAPHMQPEKVRMSNGTYHRPINHPARPIPDIESLSQHSRPTTRTPERLVSKSPGRTIPHKSEAHTKAFQENKSQRVGQEQRPDKVPNAYTSKVCEEEVVVSTRRGSGKFGVELRRTSLDSSERRRSVPGEPAAPVASSSLVPTIEDVYDLHLLEQMLEKVVGYEQRRRIRAQIRLAKKKEDTKHVDSGTYTRRSHTRDRSSAGERSAIANTHEGSAVQSAEKRTRNISPVKTPKSVRQPSPEKKMRTQSPSKTPDTSNTKPNKFNEYASAYMKRVGITDINANTHSEIKSHKVNTKHEEIKTTQIDNSNLKNIQRQTNSISRIRGSENAQVNGRRSPSPSKSNKKFQSPTRKPQANKTDTTRPISPEKNRRVPSPAQEPPSASPNRLHTRTPSPDFKRPRQTTTAQSDKNPAKHNKLDYKKITSKKTEEKPSWVTSTGLKKSITSESRTQSSKKIESEKTRYRALSPSKSVVAPTDVITSSYGLGPVDAEGKPLFGIRALRNGASSYQVKGTVMKQEYRSENGGAPVGTTTVTAYASDPAALLPLLPATEHGAVRGAVEERARSRIHGLSAITTTRRFGPDMGAHTLQKEERAALEQFMQNEKSDSLQTSVTSETKLRESRMQSSESSHKAEKSERQLKQSERQLKQSERQHKQTVRQSSVKSLTEKFIKNASETTKSERRTYPKAGLILRSGGLRDSFSSDSDAAGVVRSGSEHSLASAEGEPAEAPPGRGQDAATGARSFLNTNTKVTGVQDILTRMKNADIVIEAGDSREEAEARALLNKFLGATVLMAGMQAYVAEPQGAGTRRLNTTAPRAADTAHHKKEEAARHLDLDTCWDERVLRRLLEECSEYEERRRIRARLRQVMAEQEACAEAVKEALVDTEEEAAREEEVTAVTTSVRRNSSEKTSSTTTTTTTKVIESATRGAPKSASPFAKFRQLEKQNSLNSPKM